MLRDSLVCNCMVLPLRLTRIKAEVLHISDPTSRFPHDLEGLRGELASLLKTKKVLHLPQIHLQVVQVSWTPRCPSHLHLIKRPQVHLFNTPSTFVLCLAEKQFFPTLNIFSYSMWLILWLKFKCLTWQTYIEKYKHFLWKMSTEIYIYQWQNMSDSDKLTGVDISLSNKVRTGY